MSINFLTVYLISQGFAPSVVGVAVYFVLVVGVYLAVIIGLLWALPKVFKLLKRMFTT